MDIASEFLDMAARLVYIKTVSLLPKYDEGEQLEQMCIRDRQKVGQQANPANFLLMHAMGPNVAGVIGSAVAAGVLIAILG